SAGPGWRLFSSGGGSGEAHPHVLEERHTRPNVSLISYEALLRSLSPEAAGVSNGPPATAARSRRRMSNINGEVTKRSPGIAGCSGECLLIASMRWRAPIVPNTMNMVPVKVENENESNVPLAMKAAG